MGLNSNKEKERQTHPTLPFWSIARLGNTMCNTFIILAVYVLLYSLLFLDRTMSSPSDNAKTVHCRRQDKGRGLRH